MITDKQEEYLKNLSESKYENKALRMIRIVLNEGTPEEKVIIGKNRYDALKRKPLESRLKNEKTQVKDFEDYHGITEYVENSINLIKKREDVLKNVELRKQKAIKNITKENVFNIFLECYKKYEGVDFELTKETKYNIEQLAMYFSKDEEFLDYGVKNAEGMFLSTPSLDKGLCIIGGFGNGKTSVMKTFQKMFIGLDGYSFGRFSSQEIILKYEHASKQKDAEHLDNFWKILIKSDLYIDDVKSEPEAFAYGKKNIINTLFLERYNKKLKTHISINYAKGHNNNPLEALIEFKTKYSNQVYDRIYEMYNIIEFKGKSFRK